MIIEFLEGKIEKAVNLAFNFGWVDGDHHKMWVIDQMLRVLLDKEYDSAVAEFCDGDDGPDTYEWDTGIAP